MWKNGNDIEICLVNDCIIKMSAIVFDWRGAKDSCDVSSCPSHSFHWSRVCLSMSERNKNETRENNSANSKIDLLWKRLSTSITSAINHSQFIASQIEKEKNIRVDKKNDPMIYNTLFVCWFYSFHFYSTRRCSMPINKSIFQCLILTNCVEMSILLFFSALSEFI